MIVGASLNLYTLNRQHTLIAVYSFHYLHDETHVSQDGQAAKIFGYKIKEGSCSD